MAAKRALVVKSAPQMFCIVLYAVVYWTLLGSDCPTEADAHENESRGDLPSCHEMCIYAPDDVSMVIMYSINGRYKQVPV